MARKRRLLTAGPAVLVLLSVCGGPSTLTTPTRTPSSLAVSCDRTALATGAQAHCQARTTFSDSTTQDQTASAQWSSSDSSKLSAATGGVMTAVAAGTADVIATVQGVIGRQTITVNNGPCLFSLSPVTLAFSSSGGSQPVSVTATPLQCGPATWTASATDPGLTILPAAGDGSGSVTVTAAPSFGAAQIRLATIAGQPLTVTVAGPPPAPTYRTLALTLIQGEVLSGPYAGTATTDGGFACTLYGATVQCPILAVPDGTTVVLTVALAPQLAGLGHPIHTSNTTGCDLVTAFTTCQVLMNRDRSVTIGIGWDVSPVPF
jgi:hypothetical protein